MPRPENARRLRRNAESKQLAEHDGDPWSQDDLDWLQSWDGDEGYLVELAGMLGRTIEACREQYYQRRRSGDWGPRAIRRTTTTTTTTTRTTVEYRGWREEDGDGW